LWRHRVVDRAACAWLIRRFIDPEAEFVFVDDPDEVPPDTTPFDMRGAELSHHGGDCTFETFLRRYELADPSVSSSWREPSFRSTLETETPRVLLVPNCQRSYAGSPALSTVQFGPGRRVGSTSAVGLFVHRMNSEGPQPRGCDSTTTVATRRHS